MSRYFKNKRDLEKHVQKRRKKWRAKQGTLRLHPVWCKCVRCQKRLPDDEAA